jgi:ketosteroid isomerase-like protein
MEAQQKQMIEHYIRAYNAFDIAGMCQDLHEEVVFQNISNGKVDLETQGLPAFKEQAAKAKEFFSEREQKITNMQFGADSATVSIDYSGVLAVDLSEQMQAGDTLRLKGKSTFYFQEDKIIKIVDES